MQETCLEINTRVFKVILVGVQAVGKSSILCRLVNSQLANSYQATVGIDYHSYATVVNKKSLSLQIWDTAGQQKFRALTSTYFKNCSACICVYDLSDKESIIKTDYYLNKANQQKIPENCTFLAGNKSDLIPPQQLQNNEVRKLAEQKAIQYSIHHRIVSARQNRGVKQLFDDLAKSLGNYYQKNTQQKNIKLLSKFNNLFSHKQNCKC